MTEIVRFEDCFHYWCMVAGDISSCLLHSQIFCRFPAYFEEDLCQTSQKLNRNCFRIPCHRPGDNILSCFQRSISHITLKPKWMFKNLWRNIMCYTILTYMCCQLLDFCFQIKKDLCKSKRKTTCSNKHYVLDSFWNLFCWSRMGKNICKSKTKNKKTNNNNNIIKWSLPKFQV